MAAALALAFGAATQAAAQSPAASSASARPRPCPPPLDAMPGAMSFTYATTPAGRPLRIHVFQPAAGKGNGTAIVFFFGGGWRNGTTAAFADQAKDVTAKGYVAILPDYRVSCHDQSTASRIR